MDPVQRGTPAEFWAAATGVNLGPATGVAYASSFVEDGKAWYSVVGYSQNWPYWVPEEDAMRMRPAAIDELDRLAQLPGEDDSRKNGYLRWKKIPSGDTPMLLQCIQDEQEELALKRLSQESPPYPGAALLYAREVAGLHQAAERRSHYWMNFTFEAVFLIGCIWFAFWPLIGSLSVQRHLLHLLALPTLLLLPAWMGYCSFWPPNVRPAGGVLYPWIIAVLRNGLLNPGFELPYAWLPQIFSPLSQWDTLNLEEIRGYRDFITPPPGPMQTLAMGVALCAAYLVARVLVRHLREAQLRRPGFEVLPASDSNAPRGTSKYYEAQGKADSIIHPSNKV